MRIGARNHTASITSHVIFGLLHCVLTSSYMCICSTVLYRFMLSACHPIFQYYHFLWHLFILLHVNGNEQYSTMHCFVQLNISMVSQFGFRQLCVNSSIIFFTAPSMPSGQGFYVPYDHSQILEQRFFSRKWSLADTLFHSRQ